MHGPAITLGRLASPSGATTRYPNAATNNAAAARTATKSRVRRLRIARYCAGFGAFAPSIAACTEPVVIGW